MRIVLLLFFTALLRDADGQMITGVWKGRINKQKVEIKIIQSGDSLKGTSYYYESATTYRRYSIKGYFDATTNSTVWWDDQLLEEKSKYTTVTGRMPLLSRADFNCPGGGVMTLDGKAALKEDNARPRGDLHLDKTEVPVFNDEWDYVIENYTTGTNNLDIIDSVGAIAKHDILVAEPETSVAILQKPVMAILEPSKAPTIEEKFLNRKKVFTREIVLAGDSVELRFYDNAEIDGDSISLFLNDKLIFEHIRLTEKAYIVKLAVSELGESNELIMVAESLAST